VGHVAKLFDRTSTANTIIAKEELFHPDYLPTDALHRQNEMETVAAAIEPMIHGKACTNLFICGASGTGKTLCMKLVLDQLRENSALVTPIYVNCWDYPTKMAIYYKISEALDLILPRRGLAADEVFERILDAMKKQNMAILLVLDELDSIVFRKEDSFLYTMSRAGLDRGARFGIVAISNKNDLTRLLDSRAASSLRLSSFEFKEYNVEQLKAIVLERAKNALVPKTWNAEAIEACARAGFGKNGNARLALEILWKAAQLAEQRDSTRIELQDIEEVIKMVEQRPSRVERKKIPFQAQGMNLCEEEKLIVDILLDGERPSTELYGEFSNKKKKSKRQIRNYLQLLEARGIIESKETSYGTNDFLKMKIYALKPQGAG
jgi:cell division control protein 6